MSICFDLQIPFVLAFGFFVLVLRFSGNLLVLGQRGKEGFVVSGFEFCFRLEIGIKKLGRDWVLSLKRIMR